MAYTSLHTAEIAPRTGFGIRDFFASLFDSFEKTRQFNEISALSDAELNDRGIKRSDIARMVFLDNGLS